MARDINRMEPMDPGSEHGQIKTPMCEENVDHKNDPEIWKYKQMPTKSGDSTAHGASDIMGPGEVFEKGKK